MGSPGWSRKQVTARRSRVARQKRVVLRPHEYNKLKLRTASGGRLTIRYRSRPASLSPHSRDSGSEIFGKSGEEANYNCNTTHVNQAFDDSADFREYSQSCSCASGSILSDLPDNHHSCSSDLQVKINSFDVGRNETPQDVSSNPFSMSSERFLEGDSDNYVSWTAHRNMYYHGGMHYHNDDSEQGAELAQHLKSFSADDIDVNSTLLFMEGQESLVAGSIWSSFSQSESSRTELSTLVGQSNLHSPGSALQMNTLKSFPAFNDDIESSDIELIELPPLSDYKIADDISLYGENLLRYELNYEKQSPANGTDIDSTTEEFEPFDETKFLKLDQGMPDEVDLKNSGVLQNPNLGLPLMKSTSRDVGNVALQDPVNDAPNKLSIDVNHEGEHDGLLESEGSVCQSSSVLCSLNPVATRGKNVRKKRLRRATPLHSLKSLLSSIDEFAMDDEITASPDSEHRYRSLSMKVNIPKGCPRRCKSLLPEHAVSTLRRWFDDHAGFPFANKEEKFDLVFRTGLTLTQVENWLSNHRYKLKMRKSDFLARNNADQEEHQSLGACCM